MTEPKLQDLIDLALAAGREIMAVRAAGFDTQQKLDGSIVTIADQRAEAIIEQGLLKLAPDVPMIGEEAVALGRVPQCGQLFWCVDPLDGTRGFSEGGDEFTVNIALVREGLPTHGVVYAPATGELYAGEPGAAFTAQCDIATATPQAPLAPIQANRAALPQWRIVASQNSGRDERTANFIAALKGAATHASSSIKFCRVADGGADLYPRFGNVSEWDAAAGHAILRAADGDIMRVDGAPLRYGDRDGGFLIRGFVAYANEDAKAAALAAMR
ncbi:MAG: 3'(2'),5'-bisphosphate nucleotidase CysQ [Alphaproteobacteria bacterium]|nr:MAG: 3'(2'),5'-bisphosphate nucleotidase CysQ [Alphaproteobacteria bacterium]